LLLGRACVIRRFVTPLIFSHADDGWHGLMLVR
jgi:hypothetical protein